MKQRSRTGRCTLFAYRVSQKSNSLKAFNNIVAYAKPFSAKFYQVIGSVYVHMRTNFGELSKLVTGNIGKIVPWCVVYNIVHSDTHTSHSPLVSPKPSTAHISKAVVANRGLERSSSVAK